MKKTKKDSLTNALKSFEDGFSEGYAKTSKLGDPFVEMIKEGARFRLLQKQLDIREKELEIKKLELEQRLTKRHKKMGGKK